MAETDLLTLTQWLSPAFPVGGFAYSHGLEAAIATGQVTDAGSLEGWLSDVLRFGSGRSDAILLIHAMRDPGRAGDLAALAEAMAATRERQAETMQQGAAFTRAVNALTGAARPPAPLPVAVGLAASDLDLTPVSVAALYLHAFASNLVSAGVRFIPLGQTEGQAVLTALHPAIREVAERAATAGLEDLGTGCFGADMAAARHETLEVRLFKT